MNTPPGREQLLTELRRLVESTHVPEAKIVLIALKGALEAGRERSLTEHIAAWIKAEVDRACSLDS